MTAGGNHHFGFSLSQTTAVKRALAALALTALLGTSCSEAPDPGDLAAFCSLLETGTGLTPSPTPQDLERLVLVAPPTIRPTIEALQSRARDFSELLAEEPPDLEALFEARFDPQASTEQAELDRYALNSCAIAADRPPATRWNSYVAENHAGAPWVGLVTAQFEVASDRIATATMVFLEEPNPTSLVEEVCQATSDFLLADGADPGRVVVVIGSVIALEHPDPTGPCRMP